MAHGNEHHEAQIVGRGLLVARGQSAARFVPADTVFHEVAFPAQHLVVVDGHLAVAPARNHRYVPLCDNEAAQDIVVVDPSLPTAARPEVRRRFGPESDAHAPVARRYRPGHAVGCCSRSDCSPGPVLRTTRVPDSTDMGPHVGGVQMHPTEIHPGLGHRRQPARPDPSLAPAAKDAVPGAETGRQVSPRGMARVHYVHAPVVEGAGMVSTDPGIPAPMAVPWRRFHEEGNQQNRDDNPQVPCPLDSLCPQGPALR